MKRKFALVLTTIMAMSAANAVFAADTENKTAEIAVLLNGDKMNFDEPPYIENGTTRVPMRAIFEGLGAEVDWNSNEKTVTAKKDGVEIKLTIGDDTALVDGKENKLLVPAEIKNSRTMVPLRFVSESLGAKVDWDGTTKTITIENEKADKNETTEDKKETPVISEKEYKSKDGWSVKYNEAEIKANEIENGASFVYTGESAGTCTLDITVVKDKSAKDVAEEKIKDWDAEKTKTTEIERNGAKVLSYTLDAGKDGSGMFTGISVQDHNGGTVLTEYVLHQGGNEEMDIAANDALLNIFNSITIEKAEENKEESKDEEKLSVFEQDEEKYKSVISELKAGQGYAFADLDKEMDLLAAANEMFDNGDGTMASTSADIYVLDDEGKVIKLGSAAGSTSYPLAVKDGFLYYGSRNSIVKAYYDKENASITVKEEASVEFDKDDKETYHYSSGDKKFDGDKDAEENYKRLSEEYSGAVVLNFTAVK